MKSGWILTIIILALFIWSSLAASQQIPLSTSDAVPTLSHSEDCYAHPYPEDIGIRIGAQAQISKRPLNGNVPLYDKPQGGEVLLQMHPDETLIVLTGPECWKPYRISSGAVAHRAWYVRHEVSLIEGWVKEDEWMMQRVWNIQSLNPEPPAPQTPQVFHISYKGELAEISVQDRFEKPELAPYWQDDYQLVIEEAGYFTFELETNPDYMSAPYAQALEDGLHCRLLVLIQAEHAQPPLYAVLTDGHLRDSYAGDVEQIWLEADSYIIHVQFTYVTLGANENAYQSDVCEQTTYSLSVDRRD